MSQSANKETGAFQMEKVPLSELTLDELLAKRLAAETALIDALPKNYYKRSQLEAMQSVLRFDREALLHSGRNGLRVHQGLTTGLVHGMLHVLECSRDGQWPRTFSNGLHPADMSLRERYGDDPHGIQESVKSSLGHIGNEKMRLHGWMLGRFALDTQIGKSLLFSYTGVTAGDTGRQGSVVVKFDGRMVGVDTPNIMTGGGVYLNHNRGLFNCAPDASVGFDGLRDFDPLGQGRMRYSPVPLKPGEYGDGHIVGKSDYGSGPMVYGLAFRETHVLGALTHASLIEPDAYTEIQQLDRPLYRAALLQM